MARREIQVHRFVAFALVFALSAMATVSHAQIILDGSLGTAGALTGPNFHIPSTVGQTRGGNLFHSFGLFNVLTDQSATFTGPNSISNIFGRVTGGQPSNIDGQIRSTIPNANLYLMNPAGMMFGPNASLSVTGSFHATTADYLKFADGAKFHADLARESVLTTAPVSAFGFLSQNPAGISIQESVLQLPSGKTSSIVGGNIDITGGPLGFLAAPGGTINLAAVGSPGEVPVNVQELNLQSFDRLGQINVSNVGLLDASGNGGGTVVIRGGKLVVDSSSIFADNLGNLDGAGLGIDIQIAADAVIVNGSFITADGFGTGHARDLWIAADTLQVDNSVIGSRVRGSGDGGNVTLNIGNVGLTGGASISSVTLGSGKGGTVRVTATDTISLDGRSGIAAASQSESTGKAGNIVVEATNVRVTGGAQVVSGAFGPGNGGSVQVTATDTISLEGAGSAIAASNQPGSTGNAGDIVVEATNVTLTGGAQVFSGTFGPGNGGTVRVTATDTISLDGAGSLITASNQPGSNGNAGNTVVEANNVTVTGGAQISNVTFGLGNAGTLTVAAENVTLSGGAVISSGTFGPGNGGAVRVTATDTISLDGSLITATSEAGSTKNAGDVVVEAKNVTVTGGAQILSGTFGPGNGGTVRVNATDTITLDGAGGLTSDGLRIVSGIFAGSQPGSTGDAGNVVVEAKNVAVTGGAQIGSATFGMGKGGTVRVTASDAVSLTGGSRISSDSSGDGLAGSIEVRARQINLNDGAVITATSSGSGNAGDINIQAHEFRSANSSVTTQADFADGGNIHLTVVKLVYLLNSQLTASVGTRNGSGGNITIEPQFVVLNNSHITANAFGGPGGNITIVAENFLASPDSTITASSALSTPGTVNIQAPITDLSGSLAPLPESILQATSLLRQSCAARYGSGKLSSLASSGRGGMPFEPGGFMPSPLYRLDDQPSTTTRESGSERQTIASPISRIKLLINTPCS